MRVYLYGSPRLGTIFLCLSHRNVWVRMMCTIGGVGMLYLRVVGRLQGLQATLPKVRQAVT